MSNFRLPQNLSTQLSVETGVDRLHAEIHAEQAATLGRLGHLVEKALQQLRDFDAGKLIGVTRTDLVGDAANAVWSFFVQRDVVGLRDQDQVIADYKIPGEVLSRVGERISKK